MNWARKNGPESRFFRRGPGPVLALCLAVLACGCGGATSPRGPASAVAPVASYEVPAVTAEAWPEADALFRRDPDWLGGDGAFSIDLGGDRTLWLFGDSLIAITAARVRRESAVVRNSIAIQTGRDPSNASIRFYWRNDGDGYPASFFPEEGEEWLWPAHGVRIGDGLTIFLYRIVSNLTAGSLGFEVAGWSAVRVDDPDADPSAWRPRPLATPDTSGVGIVGVAVMHSGAHVYAYLVREPGNHDVMLLRWTEARFTAGDLMSPEWWGGPSGGWGWQAPALVMGQGATEFSVSRTRAPPLVVQVQSRDFGATTVALRFAPELTGPWTPLRDVYYPTEADRADATLYLYAGKAHPHLEGADLVATYVCNTSDPEVLMRDDRIYFPRFVRITLR